MSVPVEDRSVAATFCATLTDEWARGGVTDAVVCPGSRSTPLALALDLDERIRVHVHPDERSAGFVALGLAVSTQRAVVVLTTSGTAAVEVHPAVVEAHHSAVPLLVCTADRPTELHGVGAPQTIEQANLFGSAIRARFDPGPPDAAMASSWRSLAAHALVEATGSRPGPVHLNLAFRDPLVGEPGELQQGRPENRPWHSRPVTSSMLGDRDLRTIVELCASRGGVLIAGAAAGEPAPILELAQRLGWPVFADPRSGCRTSDDVVVRHFDPILRVLESVPAAARFVPEVVIVLGQPPSSKVLDRWIVASGADRVIVETHGRRFDPDRAAGLMVDMAPSRFCAALIAELGSGDSGSSDSGSSDSGCGNSDGGWAEKWRSLDAAARRAVETTLGSFEAPTGPGTARSLLEAMQTESLRTESVLVVSSSMPIRDVEWFSGPTGSVRVVANRGANGIDGVVSTAVGVALSGVKTTLLIGDLAFLHDANGLIGVLGRAVDLTIVVVDNDGGGIFSFLPQASGLSSDRFERLFGTPHGVDLGAIASAHGITATVVESKMELGEAITTSLARGGVNIVIVKTSRHQDVVAHELLNAAVTAAVELELDDDAT